MKEYINKKFKRKNTPLINNSDLFSFEFQKHSNNQIVLNFYLLKNNF